MLGNIQEQNTSLIERIPLKERNAFQVFLMKKVGMDRGQENHDVSEEWAMKYAGKVSEIIDDVNREDNKIIRPLIMRGDYEEASEHVLKALEEKKYN